MKVHKAWGRETANPTLFPGSKFDNIIVSSFISGIALNCMKRFVRKYKPYPPKFSPLPSSRIYEAEVMTGLKPFAVEELQRLLGKSVHILRGAKPEEILFEYSGDTAQFLKLRQVAAVYQVEPFAIPRPLALLGHQNFQRLLAQIKSIQDMHPPGNFRTFRLSAAGKNSSVFNRIKTELQAQLGLRYDDDEGQLFLRIRPSQVKPDGWDVLIRLTPRPLSARDWRVCDMLGALNATIASVMIEITQPAPDDRVLNLMCGSGTLLVERMLRMPTSVIAGCDIDPEALACAEHNLRASGFPDKVDLFQMDATRLQLPDACIDALYADLPWGQLVGSHDHNRDLYPRVLVEAARIAAPGARFVLISHEIRLLESVLSEHAHLWKVQNVVKVFQGGLHPRIYLLSRTDS